MSDKTIRFINKNETQVFEVPRRDCREAAFRKYEQDIAAACKGSIVVDPGIKMSARTYIARFKDAILGYKRYKYPSTIISDKADVALLKPKEIADNKVLIECPFKADAYDTKMDQWHATDEFAHIEVSDMEKLKEFVKVVYSDDEVRLQRMLKHSVHFKTPEEFNEAMSILKDDNIFGKEVIPELAVIIVRI